MKRVFCRIVCTLLLCAAAGLVFAQSAGRMVGFDSSADGVALAAGGRVATLVIDKYADPGLKRAVFDLADDFRKVTGVKAPVEMDGTRSSVAVIIGIAGQSPLIEKLIKSGDIEASELDGKREKFIIKTIASPWDDKAKAVVIAGSDKRGAIYGVYELSRQIGVSPWYFWADVPTVRRERVVLLDGTYTDGEPEVELRGIFLNDEAPALTGWVNENFGGYNSKFYLHVFELLLRLKANFLWPAMWDAAFYDDDPLNSVYARQCGIVIGTTHHEPMGRAHKEWARYGSGAWDYSKNSRVLDDFWRKGVERMQHTEDIVTLAMRGDGDEPMSRENNIALLEKIVKNQRKIISEVTGKPADRTPQVWALYKEVQEYYDEGMRVPDDVTLLLCDDNWGNIRKLPELTAAPRSGGYGMYYHFDYVGGPRNYKWLNVTQVQRVWEQMNLCYEYGVRKLWVVNVGDLKPMEYPIQFFLDMAWNPTQFNEGNIYRHTVDFCTAQFGEKYAERAARIINLYTKYNRRVTPELLDANTYSLTNYDEFRRVTDDYTALEADALRLYHLMPATMRDAFDQLALFPVQAMANLYRMYYAVAMNHVLAKADNPEANRWAELAKEYFNRDAELTDHYNKVMSGGKWNHMMDQTHIGYTYWQQPEVNKMPELMTVEPKPVAEMVFVENDGHVSIEAEHYSRRTDIDRCRWIVIPDLSKTLSGVTTYPPTEVPDSCVLEYDIEFSTADSVRVEIWCAPTLNFNANRGLRYGISFDGMPEQVVNINAPHTRRDMERWQATSVNITSTRHLIPSAGVHTLRIRVLDAGIVIQKIQIDTGGLKPAYLGAPESKIK